MAAASATRSFLATAITAGASGALLASNGDIVAHLLKEIVSACAQIAARVTAQSPAQSTPAASTSSRELSELTLQVQELSKILHKVVLFSGAKGADVARSETSSGQPSWFAIAILTSLGATGAMHLGGFKVGAPSFSTSNWPSQTLAAPNSLTPPPLVASPLPPFALSFSQVFPFNLIDSFFVTKGVFKAGMSRIGAEVGPNSGRSRSLTTHSLARSLAPLELFPSPLQVASLGERLRQTRLLLMSKMDSLDAKVESIDAKADDLDSTLSDLARDVQQIKKGVFILCRVVVKHLKTTEAPSRSEIELEHYLKDEAPLPGLRELLEKYPTEK